MARCIVEPAARKFERGEARRYVAQSADLAAQGLVQDAGAHRQAAFGGCSARFGERGDKADGALGGRREFVFLFARVRREAPLQEARGQPIGDVGLRGLRQMMALAAQFLKRAPMRS
jgi:hypothetical protein